MRIFFIFLVFVFGVLAGCKDLPEKKIDFEVETFSYQSIAYPETEINIPTATRNEFVQNFFSPWESSSQDLIASLDDFPGKDISYLEKYLKDDAWYGENKKPHKKGQRQQIVSNADAENFPNFQKKGIIIAHTDLRRIPTTRPGFDTYSKAGEGYPFDYFQETALWANTPVFIAHFSKDKQWSYVVSPYYKGWVSTHDVAVVDDNFIREWSSKSLCYPLSDDVTLQDTTSLYAVNSKIGMVLPYEDVANSSDKIQVWYAHSDTYQNATILKSEVNREDFAFKKYPFDKGTLESLVAQLVGKPYGWGGMLENRDCSAMIRDLLGTYGIWLPRDSGDQVDTGNKFEMPESVEEKVKLIKEKGIPFLTILRKNGHNMLYVGNGPNGEPLILHAIWGLKTSYANNELEDLLNTYPIEGIHKEEDGTFKGRYIIGESVITSVYAGTGNEDIPLSIIEEIYAMTNILEN